jgi:hypothetical protein
MAAIAAAGAHPAPETSPEAPPHLGLLAQIARAMHLDVGAYEDVARDARYGWKVTLLVLLGGLCLGASMGLPGMLVGMFATVIAWLVLSSACSMYGSIPFAACARTIGMGFYPLLLAGYTMLAADYPTLLHATWGVAVVFTLASVVAAILRLGSVAEEA